MLTLIESRSIQDPRIPLSAKEKQEEGMYFQMLCRERTGVPYILGHSFWLQYVITTENSSGPCC